MNDKSSKHRSDFLLPKNDFLVGLGSLLNIHGDYFKYNSSKSGKEADSKALESDWGVIGNDINNSINKFTELCK